MISKIKTILNLNSKDPSRPQPVALNVFSLLFRPFIMLPLFPSYDCYKGIWQILFICSYVLLHPCLSQANCYQRFNLHQHVYLQLEMHWFDPIQLLSMKLVDILSLILQQRFMVIQKSAVCKITTEVNILYSTYWKCSGEFLFNWWSHSLRIDSDMAQLI